MKMLRDESANAGALLGGFVGLILVLFFVFIVGAFIDPFQGKMNNMELDVDVITYPNMGQVSGDMFTLVFASMILFSITIVVWMFKVSIYDVYYSRKDEELEGQFKRFD